MDKVKVKKAASATAKAAVPIVVSVLLARLTTGKLDLKAAALDVVEGAVRAARTKRAETER